MAKAETVKVSVLKHHTFRGKDYEPGQSYVVDGDEAQTAAQYVDTLRATGLARPADEAGQGPNIVDEIRTPEEQAAVDAAAKGDTRVKALGTEDFNQSEPVAPAAKRARAAKAPKASAGKVARASAGKKAK